MGRNYRYKARWDNYRFEQVKNYEAEFLGQLK